MIKLIIFDLDGVLADIRDSHFHALNHALSQVDKKYVISYEDHLKHYDGRPTKEKLKILTEKKGLPSFEYERIFNLKQKEFLKLCEAIKPDKRLTKVLKRLKKDYILACASNAIRQTVKTVLLRKGFLEYLDFFLSNEDVLKPKPSPEIYLRCMITANAGPRETLVIEDSKVGIEAARNSGAKVEIVKSSKEVTYDLLS